VSALLAPIAAAFRASCRDELNAPKPGNVHNFSPGHRMTAVEFVRSADAAALPLSQPGARVGRRILDAVDATFAAVGTNTNLGIILLCTPLAAAAENARADLRTALRRVLDELDVEDASLAFRAIARAAPAGLGRAKRHDVFAPAAISLREAMAEAAGYDRIARQYVSAFADVFELGLPELQARQSSGFEHSWATLAVYVAFLSAFPDSHIVRKHGIAAAETTCRVAQSFKERIQTPSSSPQLLKDLLTWDASLKAAGINPGTSADLTVATLFAHRLQSILPSLNNNA
jgi:triphosphoribosyl-dephospho-CoA synthase